MVVKNAAIRAVRTAAQAAAGALAGFPIAEAVFDFKVIGSAYGLAALVGFNAGVISFLQNVGEDNTSVEVPK